MFHNSMTEKMPCWKCLEYGAPVLDGSGGCPHLRDFLKTLSGRYDGPAISGLRFDCNQFKGKDESSS